MPTDVKTRSPLSHYNGSHPEKRATARRQPWSPRGVQGAPGSDARALERPNARPLFSRFRTHGDTLLVEGERLFAPLTEAFPSDSRLRRSAGLLASGKHVGNNNGLPLEGPRVRSKRATLAPAYAIEGD